MASKKAEPEKEKRRPDYVARARQSEGSDFFFTIGAAWKTEINGRPALSVKINAMPMNFDGSFLLMEPKEE